MDSQWITADPQRHPFFRPREAFSSFKRSLHEAKSGCFDEAPRQRRDAKYHYHDSVDISTANAPIEDRTKGGDSLRRNLTHKKTYLVSIFQI